MTQKKRFKIIRLSNIYGDNFNAPLALSNFIKNSVKLGKINLTINKKSLKDYLSIDDAIHLILTIINKGKKNIYNVASGKRISLDQITKKIQKITKCKILLSSQNLRINEPKININRIRSEFKFKQSSHLLKDLNNLLLDFKNTIHK